MKKRILRIGILCIGILMALCACGAQSQSANNEGVDFTTLEKTKSWELAYATEFSVDEYGDYALLSVSNGERYLIVPEGKTVPKRLDSDIVVLQQPFDKTYLLSTSVMDMLDALGCLDQVRMTGTKESDWYLPAVIDAMKKEEILFAGKYSKPDYELILSEGCNLALENTMILHNPEVKEKLEELGIPVFIERSSYESHPLGRLEWIKVYGLLYGKTEEANAFFEKEVNRIEPVMEKEKTGQSVIFFYVTTNGAIHVHKPNSYIAKMIELAGGEYAWSDRIEVEDNALSTMNMQVEDFYLLAKNADVLIYNSTVVGEVQTIDDIIAKNDNFKDFKAVKAGNVYCTSNNFFQESTGLCDFIEEVNHMLEAKDTEGCRFLFQLR